MIFKPFFFILLINISIIVKAQPSLKNPQICHDNEGYLRCYNDGTYILKFEKGDFKEFKTFDSSVTYSNSDKTISLHEKSYLHPLWDDTIKIKLLPHSILLKKGDSTLEITSLSKMPSKIYEFDLGTYSVNSIIEGFVIYSGDNYFEIPIMTYPNWSWDIRIKEKNRRSAILFNVFKKNRLDLIFIQDDSLKYGMTLSTTFRSLKKVSNLSSQYTDTMTINGRTCIGSIPLDKNYYYDYNSSGRLKTKTIVGELKLCDCD